MYDKTQYNSKKKKKKQRHYFTNKCPSSQSYGFSSSHVWMWELDYKESWALKTWCFWTVVWEKTLKSPLDRKEIQPVHPAGKQFWIVIEKTDAEAETPLFWPPDAKLSGCLLWKNVSLDPLPIFCLGYLFFCSWATWAAFVFLEINPLSVTSFSIVFSLYADSIF